MLRAALEGAGTGTLSGHANQEARSAGRFDGAGAVPRTRALAGQLRPVLGGAERAGGQAGGDASDDRRAATGPRVWPGTIAPGAGTGMCKRGVGPLSPERHEPGGAAGSRGSRYRGTEPV